MKFRNVKLCWDLEKLHAKRQKVQDTCRTVILNLYLCQNLLDFQNVLSHMLKNQFYFYLNLCC